MEKIGEVLKTMANNPELSNWIDYEIPDSQIWRKDRIFGDKYKHNTFKKDDGSNKTVTNICKSYVMNITKMMENRVGLRFHGEVGTGKSFYASAIADALISRKIYVIMIDIPQLIQLKMNGNEWIEENFCKASVAIVDDFGVERMTDFMIEQTYNLINQRYLLNSGVTILTTNIAKKEIETPNEDIRLTRIYSRIVELCPIAITLTGNDKRKANSEKLKNLFLPDLLESKENG